MTLKHFLHLLAWLASIWLALLLISMFLISTGAPFEAVRIGAMVIFGNCAIGMGAVEYRSALRQNSEDAI
jgi:hypothetical protein